LSFLKIVSPGLLTTIQDRGRFNYQRWGIPVAGAMDEYALRVANILVGNHEDEACLEITLLGPEINFLEPGLISLTGADLGASLNGSPVEPWQSFPVKKGDVLRFAGVSTGCRGYLGIVGGFKIPRVMASKSTYLRGNFGGLKGRSLREGDELDVEHRVSIDKLTPLKLPPDYWYEYVNPYVVRVILGPQDDSFTGEGIETFLQSNYTVSHESDRMGCRLDGPVIKHKKDADIISDGVAMGSIQVPGKGTPIVMMAERQTTGGYAKIATVITPDLWKLAQAKPGDAIKFTAITPEQAREIYIEYENTLKKLPLKLASLQEKQWEKGEIKKLLVKVAGKEYQVEIQQI
jgi:biotin-dependent carboxylase-like uncharacterized protein